MSFQHATVKYYIEDGLVEIKEILQGCQDGTLVEEEYVVLLQHALQMMNIAFNGRSISRKLISEMSQGEYEKLMHPPKEID